MKKYNFYIFLILLFNINSYSAPMEFELVGNGGNCNGCEWISAEGEIVKETPLKLETFLKEWEYIPKIVFNSSGGNLLAALEMGKILRKYNARVSIGDTIEETPAYSSYRKLYFIEKGYCLSSCVYAFLGGIERSIGSEDKLGFDQLHNNKMTQDLTGVLEEYLDLMRINRNLYLLIAKIHSDQIYYLSKNELNKYGIETDNHSTTK